MLVAIKRPELIISASKAVQRPRCAGGMNSQSVPAATTSSAPSPMPITKRRPISQKIDGANAAAIDVTPKSARLIWYDERRPKRSPR